MTIIGESVEMPVSKCTGCSKEVDMASCIGEEAKPKAGDVTVCIDCGHIMVFDEDRLLRDPTDSEAVGIAGDQRILAIQWARGKLKQKGK